MTDDRFFQRLRDDARQLQFAPDEVTVVRLTARIRARVAAPPTVSQMLAGWLRPIAAAVAAVALASVLGLSWTEQTHDNASVDQIAANTTEIAVDGVTLSAAE
jgi:hypothetical protein